MDEKDILIKELRERIAYEEQRNQKLLDKISDLYLKNESLHDYIRNNTK